MTSLFDLFYSTFYKMLTVTNRVQKSVQNCRPNSFEHLSILQHFPAVCTKKFLVPVPSRILKVRSMNRTFYANRDSMLHPCRGIRFIRSSLRRSTTPNKADFLDLRSFWKETVGEVLRIFHSTEYDESRIQEPILEQLFRFATTYRSKQVLRVACAALIRFIFTWNEYDDHPRDHPKNQKGNLAIRSKLIEFVSWNSVPLPF